MHYYTRRTEKSHGAQTMTSKLGFTRSVIIKNGKSFIVNCGFCAWPPTFDNPIPYQYKPFDVYKYIGSWSIVYRCMEWNYNHQTTVFLNTQSFSTETTNPSMPLTAFIFQTTTLYNVAIAQTTYDSDKSPTSILMTNTYNIQFKALHVLSENNAIADA